MLCFALCFIEYLVVVFPRYWIRRREEAEKKGHKTDMIQVLLSPTVVSRFFLLAMSVVGFVGHFRGWSFLYGAFSIQLAQLALTQWSVMRLLVIPALVKSAGQMLQVLGFVVVLSFFFAAVIFTIFPADFETNCEFYAECIAVT